MTLTHYQTYFIGFYALLVMGLMYFLNIRKPPEWIKGSVLESTWGRKNTTAFIIATALSIPFMLLLKNVSIVGLPILLYIFIISLSTDFKLRLVDRRLFNFSGLMIAPVTFYFVKTYYPSHIMVTYIILLLFMSAFVFLPLIGASDGRALTLGTLIIFPTTSFNGIIHTVIAFMILIAFYFAVEMIKQRQFKISIPAVPFITLSFLAALFYSYYLSTVG